jgi:hypothetical protein
MKVDRDQALELMALDDGELGDDAAARARALAREQPTAAALAGSLRDPRIAGWLRESMGERASRAGVDGLADDVFARLDAVTDEAGPAARARLSARRTFFFGHWTQVGAGLAIAAGAAMVLAATHAHREGVGTTTPVASTLAESSALAGGGGVELHEIDALSEVSVFEITGSHLPAAEKAPPSSVVIWIEDEAQTEKGP